MRPIFVLTLGLAFLCTGCQLLETRPAEPIVPPPLQVKAAAPITAEEINKDNAVSSARRLREECEREFQGGFMP